MKKLFIITCFAIYLSLGTSVVLGQNTVYYTESNAVIANPERGLQKYSITNNNYNTNSNYSNLSQNTLTSWRTGNDKITVLFRYFLLSNFLTTDISQNYLDNIRKDFSIIRNSGIKCIIRFSYSNAQSSSIQQPNKSIILSHLLQLAPLLEENKDVILTHQAGFIGTWGEWYYTNSNEFGTDGSINNTQWQNRKEVIQAMLLATPIEIPIQVRYAQIKKTMFGNNALNLSKAYLNTPQARIGFYNDAFLNNWGDQGTYSVNSSAQNPIGTADYTYMANETLYTPMTGETNGLNAPRTNASNAIIEMDSANWTTINRDYFEENWNNWIADGYYDQILKNLGYRFVLKNSIFQVIGNNLNITISAENQGYARLFKKRNVYLVLKNSQTQEEQSFLLDTDPRTWQKNIKISQTIDISTLSNGTYKSYIYMPDMNTALEDRSEYSIRFANENLWEQSSGYNNLLQTFTFETVTGFFGEEFPNSIIQILPNPVTDHTKIISEYEIASYTLINSSGEEIFSSTTTDETEKQINLDLSQLPSGIYFINISYKLVYKRIEKIIKY